MTNTPGDIIKDTSGWYFRQGEDGMLHCLSTVNPTTKVDPLGRTITLFHNGAPTTNDDAIGTRVAVVLARRYA